MLCGLLVDRSRDETRDWEVAKHVFFRHNNYYWKFEQNHVYNILEDIPPKYRKLQFLKI